MRFFLPLILSVFSSASLASHYGFSFGTGLPYVTQYGLSYASDSFTGELNFNSLSISSGIVSVAMTKPEVAVKWHPFSAALYLGLGIGQFTLSSEATDATTSQTAKVEISALSVTPSIGWLWGKSDGGIIFGLDFGYQVPMSPKTTITSALPTTNETYVDTLDEAEKLGETSIPLITYFKIGYLF